MIGNPGAQQAIERLFPAAAAEQAASTPPPAQLNIRPTGLPSRLAIRPTAMGTLAPVGTFNIQGSYAPEVRQKIERAFIRPTVPQSIEPQVPGWMKMLMPEAVTAPQGTSERVKQELAFLGEMALWMVPGMGQIAKGLGITGKALKGIKIAETVGMGGLAGAGATNLARNWDQMSTEEKITGGLMTGLAGAGAAIGVKPYVAAGLRKAAPAVRELATGEAGMVGKKVNKPPITPNEIPAKLPKTEDELYQYAKGALATDELSKMTQATTAPHMAAKDRRYWQKIVSEYETKHPDVSAKPLEGQPAMPEAPAPKPPEPPMPVISNESVADKIASGGKLNLAEEQWRVNNSAAIEDMLKAKMKSGVTPPPKPPEPPAGAKPPPAEKPWQRLVRYLKSDEVTQDAEARRQVQGAERAARLAAYDKELDRNIANGVPMQQAEEAARTMLSGKLPVTETDIAKAFTDDFVNSLKDEIIERGMKLRGTKLAEYNIPNALKAIDAFKLQKAIPVSNKPHSYYQVLLRIFGEELEIVNILTGKTPLPDVIKKTVQRGKFDLRRAPTTGAEPTGVPGFKHYDEAFWKAQQGKILPEQAELLELTGKPLAKAETEALKLDLAGKPVGAGAEPKTPLVPEAPFKEPQMGGIPTPAKWKDMLNKAETSPVEAANLLRTVIVNPDFSMPFRQGLVAMARDPVGGFKSFKPMFKAFYSEKMAEQSDELVRTWVANHPTWAEEGLQLTSWKKGVPLTNKEESFLSRYTQYIPLIKRSERAAVTFLNHLRMRRASMLDAGMVRLRATRTDYRQMAKLINISTGRGDLPKWAIRSAPVLNALLFSPRLMASRLELLPMLFSSSPMVRKEAAKTVAAFLGMGVSILGLYKLAGGKVELDPRSSDVGKMTIGNTRMDIWGGHIQYARFMAQIAPGQRKDIVEGIVPYNRWDIAVNFLQSKTSPFTSLIADTLEGKDYSGDPMTWKREDVLRQVYERMTPLMIQDTAEAIASEGALTGTALGTAAGFGVGVITYTGKTVLEQTWAGQLRPYYALPSATERKKMLELNPDADVPSNEQWREDHPDTDAKLFLTGQVKTLRTMDAVIIAERLLNASGKVLPKSDVEEMRVLIKASRDKLAKQGIKKTTSRQPVRRIRRITRVPTTRRLTRRRLTRRKGSAFKGGLVGVR